MTAICHNPNSKYSSIRTTATVSCPHWHQSFIPQRGRSRICFVCAFHGEEGRRLRRLADYINPIKT